MYSYFMLKQAARPMLKVKKLSDAACIPYRASDGSAGYDLSRYVTTDICGIVC